MKMDSRGFDIAMRLRWLGVSALLLLGAWLSPEARGEAMLQYFNTSWREITEKMPELAEAGYSGAEIQALVDAGVVSRAPAAAR